MNIDSVWQVTTESDVEGEHNQNLGTFTGKLHDIAFHLAKFQYYKLTFTEIELPKLTYSPTKDIVNITVYTLDRDFNIKLANAHSFERAKIIQDAFNEKNIEINVSPSTMFNSVQLNLRSKTDELKKQQALSKLTDEEKQLLGL